MWESLYLEWALFVMVMALGQFSPGPDMILLTRVALSDGSKSGCATATGIATGLMVHAGVAIFFVEILTSQSSLLLRNGLFILASIYLLWLAYCLLSSAFIGYYSGQKLEIQPTHRQRTKSTSLGAHYRRGLLCNLLNPKVAIFLAGVVLPFQQAASNSSAWSLILWLTIVLEGAILWCLWVKLLQTNKIKNGYSRYSFWIDGFFGVALLLLAAIILKDILYPNF